MGEYPTDDEIERIKAWPHEDHGARVMAPGEPAGDAREQVREIEECITALMRSLRRAGAEPDSEAMAPGHIARLRLNELAAQRPRAGAPGFSDGLRAAALIAERRIRSSTGQGLLATEVAQDILRAAAPAPVVSPSALEAALQAARPLVEFFAHQRRPDAVALLAQIDAVLA